MEENVNKEPQTLGPKPLKRFTPPPETVRDESDSAEEDSATEESEAEDEGKEEFGGLRDNDLMEVCKMKCLRFSFLLYKLSSQNKGVRIVP